MLESYSLADFVLFSPRAYHRLFVLHNTALWPAPLLTLAAGVGLFVVMARSRPLELRAALTALALLWLWIGWGFLWQRYAPINWAVVYLLPGFVVQALLLLGLAWGATPAGAGGSVPTHAGTVRARRWRRADRLAPLATGLLTVLAYPGLAALAGRPWSGAEVFGMAPDPTALATLAVAACLPGRGRWWLVPIPVLWCAVSTLTLAALQAPHAALPLTAALAITALMAARSVARAWRNRYGSASPGA